MTDEDNVLTTSSEVLRQIYQPRLEEILKDEPIFARMRQEQRERVMNYRKQHPIKWRLQRIQRHLQAYAVRLVDPTVWRSDW